MTNGLGVTTPSEITGGFTAGSTLSAPSGNAERIYAQLIAAGIDPQTALILAPIVANGTISLQDAIAQYGPAATGTGTGTSGGGGTTVPAAIYLNTLQELGFTNLGDLGGLIAQAQGGGWGMAEFMFNLRKTKAYEERFPGIFGRNGQMLMTEAQYISYEQQYRSITQNFGFKFTQEDVGTWISKGVDPGELQQRFEVIQRADQYRPALQQLKQTLAKRGLADKGKITLAEARDFILGLADPRWYKVYEEFSGRVAARQAGFDIVKGSDAFGYTTLTRKQILDIIHRVPGIQGETELAAGFQELVKRYRELLPEGRITGFEVSKKDLDQLTFGGPRQAKIAERVARIIATVEARQQPLAQPQFVATGQGPELFGMETQPRAQVQ